MTPTTIIELRERLQTGARLEHTLALLRAIRAGKIPRAETDRIRFVKKHFVNYGAAWRGEEVPPGWYDGDTPNFPRIHEAIRSARPSKAWTTWFLKIVRRRDFEDPEIINVLGGSFGRDMRHLQAAVTDIPPVLFAALGEAFRPEEAISAVRATLRPSLTEAEMDAAIREDAEAFGGRERVEKCCHRWHELIPILKNHVWVVEWPDFRAIAAQFEQALAAFERQGRTDLTPTIEEIIDRTRELLDELRPGWLPTDGSQIRPDVKRQLLAGVLAPPDKLKRSVLPDVIGLEFRPAGVSDNLTQEALRTMFRAEEWQIVELSYRLPSDDMSRTDGFVCPSSECGDAAVADGSSGSDDASARQTPPDHSESLVVDRAEFAILWKGTPLRVSAGAQFKTLVALIERGPTVTYIELWRAARGAATSIPDAVERLDKVPPGLSYAVSKIRLALRDAKCPWGIKAVLGQGYKLHRS